MRRFRPNPDPRQQATPTTARTTSRRRFGLSASTKRSLVILAILALIALLLFVTAPFWINWLWFGSVGYRSVITTNYLAQGLSFFVAALVAALLFWTNVRLALRNTMRHDLGEDGRLGRASNAVLKWLSLLATAIIAFLAGNLFANRWQELLLFLNGKSFDVTDPAFNRDAGFYIFQLPFLRTLESMLLTLLVITIAAVLIIYLIRMGVRFRNWGDVPMMAVRHIMALLSAALLIMALRYILTTWELVHSSRGVVTGPGFTDMNVVRPLNYLMAFLSAALAIGLLSGYVLRNFKLLLGLIGTWALLAFVVTPLLPMGVQRFIVEPSEFARERTYIENNIQMTRAGFGLNEVENRELTGQGQVDPATLSADEPPLSNVRIWDYRVVGPVYQQVQSFVPYYQFPDVDVDRYQIDGQTEQVLVGVRELNVDGLAENRRSWTNVHLVYTHGYGYVMSPVSEVSSEGWPVPLVNGVPIEGPAELLVDNPQVYFGETDLQWIVLFTDQTEIAGLDDSGSASSGYQGDVYGSISLGNPVTRAMAALTLGDRNVFFSEAFTGRSRLVQTRNVVERANRIAPFLEYDNDPYMVVADGRMYWVIDAYTESDDYPIATEYGDRNYLRNSVKVVVDAYSGETTFYRTAVDDPIADAWGDVYGDLFTPVSEAPPAIAEHFRYPELQFQAQSDVWSDYHMDDARTWYDGDDRWAIAHETSEGDEEAMEPYFVNQILPGDSESSFALTIPFTPGGNRTNENMTAWFAGTADETGQTTLRLYRYPRQVTVYGPRQIEAQINQDPDISQQITLWNQGGSQVIRGNMLVIPMDDAMLYVQPLYLQASGSTASAPRLARVIVATNDQIVMRPTLGEAIAALDDPNADVVDQIEENPDDAVSQTGEPQATPVANEPSVDTAALPTDLRDMTPEELAQEALATSQRMEDARLALDSDAYEAELARLQSILAALAGEPAASPVATPTN